LQGDNQFGDSNKYGYIAYFSILIVWEVMPTYIIIFFFRVRLPSYSYRSTVSSTLVFPPEIIVKKEEKKLEEG